MKKKLKKKNEKDLDVVGGGDDIIDLNCHIKSSDEILF